MTTSLLRTILYPTRRRISSIPTRKVFVRILGRIHPKPADLLAGAKDGLLAFTALVGALW